MLLLEEYSPEIVYIKGLDNVVADAISCLEYDPKINVKNLHYIVRHKVLVKLLNKCTKMHGGESPGIGNYPEKRLYTHHRDGPDVRASVDTLKEHVRHVFVNGSKEENDIYPPTISEIAVSQ